MTDWINGFIIPIVKVSILFGIIGFVLFFFIKAFRNAWKKSVKFTLRYKILRKQYPEKTVKWLLDCIDHGIGYYDAKKLLMIKMFPQDHINETMWIYDQIINQMNKESGGVKNGRNLKGSNRKTKGTTAEFPTNS